MLSSYVLRSAPALQPTVWYGLPGYPKDGKTVCFFRADKKYMTFGFAQEAKLTREEGAPHQLIESAWYFTALDDATEAKRSVDAQRRLYRLKPEPLQEVDVWLAPPRCLSTTGVAPMSGGYSKLLNIIARGERRVI